MALELYIGRREEMDRHVEENHLDAVKCRHIRKPDQLWDVGHGYGVNVHIVFGADPDLVDVARLRFGENHLHWH
jgi:hypothetical protein